MSICSSVAVTAACPCSSTGDVDRPELPADAARSEPRDVGHDRRLRLRDVELVEVALRLLAQRPRIVVVAVDERRVLVQRAGALERAPASASWLSLARARAAASARSDQEREFWYGMACRDYA